MDPISSSFASGISATIKIFEVIYQIQAADEQTSDILNTANHVQRNLKEAQRLLRTRIAFLDSQDYEWVESTIRDTRDALQSIAKLIEPARVEKMTQKDLGIWTKTYWAFKSNPQARDKHAMLNVCHQTLMVVITRLHSTNLPTVSEVPDQETLPPPPYDHNMEKLWTWRDLRKSRRSTTSLRDDIKDGQIFPSTRQEVEVPHVESNSYSATTSIMGRQRGGHPADEVRNYNTDYRSKHSDTPPKPAPSHNEAFESSSPHMSSTAPYSYDRWPNASHSDISLPGSGNLTSTYPVYASHETSPVPERKTQIYEMSAEDLSLEQQMPQLIGREISQPRKPNDRLTQSCLLPRISIQPPLPALTHSNLIPQSWGSLASAEGPHLSHFGGEPLKTSEISSAAESPAYRSELEAEAVEGDAVSAPDAGLIEGARRTERASMDRIWASSAWSSSSPDLASTRPGIGDRVRSTGNRNGRGAGLRGSWLFYQTSLRDSGRGREGAGWP